MSAGEPGAATARPLTVAERIAHSTPTGLTTRDQNLSAVWFVLRKR